MPAEAVRFDARFADRVSRGNALLSRLFGSRPGGVVLPAGDAWLRAPLLVAPCEGASSILVTFGGNGGELMLPSAVTRLADTHVIALRDPTRCFALRGVPGLGESYAECLGSLQRLIAALGGLDVFCYGNSAGGYPALRYGLDLRARAVMGYGAPTTLDLADDPGAPPSRYPQLAALYRRLPDFPLDLSRLYISTVPRPRVVLYYSPSDSRDAWLAGRMAQIDGVELNVVAEEAGHRVFTWLQRANEVPAQLRRLMTLQPVTTADLCSA